MRTLALSLLPTLLLGQSTVTQVGNTGGGIQFPGGGSSGGGGASAVFSTLASGTNTTAAMIVGSGASIAPSGSGAITATKLGSGSYVPVLTSGAPSAATNADLNGPTFCADAGSTDAYACDLSPAITSYTTGNHYRIKANTANTGAATVQLNSIAGPKTIVKAAGGITTTLADNDIRAGQWIDLVYDGTNMQLQSTLGNAASGGSPGSPSLSLQYNNAGAFAGLPLFSWDNSSNDVSATVFIGSGLNDATFGGTSSAGGLFFCVVISLTGTPDSFQWSSDNCNTMSSDVAITGAAQALTAGVTVTFGATTGHTLNDTWKAQTWGLGTPSGSGGLFYMPTGSISSQLEFKATGTFASILALTTGGYDTAQLVRGANAHGNLSSIQLSDQTGSSQAAAFDASGNLTGITNAAGALTNDGSGNLSWQPSGQTPCTFATLGTVLTTANQSCYCSDCDLTSGSNNTCASGTGPAVATLIGSVNACFQ